MFRLLVWLVMRKEYAGHLTYGGISRRSCDNGNKAFRTVVMAFDVWLDCETGGEAHAGCAM